MEAQYIYMIVFVIGFAFSMILQPRFLLTLLKKEGDEKENKELECHGVQWTTRAVHGVIAAVLITATVAVADRMLVNDAVIRTQKLARVQRQGY